MDTWPSYLDVALPQAIAANLEEHNYIGCVALIFLFAGTKGPKPFQAVTQCTRHDLRTHACSGRIQVAQSLVFTKADAFIHANLQKWKDITFHVYVIYTTEQFGVMGSLVVLGFELAAFWLHYRPPCPTSVPHLTNTNPHSHTPKSGRKLEHCRLL